MLIYRATVWKMNHFVLAMNKSSLFKKHDSLTEEAFNRTIKAFVFSHDTKLNLSDLMVKFKLEVLHTHGRRHDHNIASMENYMQNNVLQQIEQLRMKRITNEKPSSRKSN